METPRDLIDTHLLYSWLTDSSKLGNASVQRLREADVAVTRRAASFGSENTR